MYLLEQVLLAKHVRVDPPWLDRRQLHAWVRLRAVLELLPATPDAQIRRDGDLDEFAYDVLAMLSDSPAWTLRMTEVARRTAATLPRLSPAVTRLESRGLVERSPCSEDRRATNARLTEAGWAKVQHAAPHHVATVRHHVVDALTAEQLDQLAAIGDALLARLDPWGAVAATYTRYDEEPAPRPCRPAAGAATSTRGRRAAPSDRGTPPP
jgi:DNA-binding MarR family transcriptional regulator